MVFFRKKTLFFPSVLKSTTFPSKRPLSFRSTVVCETPRSFASLRGCESPLSRRATISMDTFWSTWNIFGPMGEKGSVRRADSMVRDEIGLLLDVLLSASSGWEVPVSAPSASPAGTLSRGPHECRVPAHEPGLTCSLRSLHAKDRFLPPLAQGVSCLSGDDNTVFHLLDIGLDI